MRKILYEALILMLITFTAGLLLAYVHEITLLPIQQQELLTKQKAIQEVFENADHFVEDNTIINRLQKQVAKEYDAVLIEHIFYAFDHNNHPLGYVLQIMEKEGYGGDIVFLMGIQNDGTLNGISFLSLSETAGLGMKADTKDFKQQFKGIRAETITYTKQGAQSSNEIDAISGATITTKAVTKGVNAGFYAYRYLLKEAAK